MDLTALAETVSPHPLTTPTRYYRFVVGPLTFTNSLSECLSVCANTPDCIAVSWCIGAPGPCYLKNELRPVVPNANIIGGRRLSNCTANFELTRLVGNKSA